MPEKFIEEVKRERLYDEYQQGNDIESMLQQSPTNSRVNQGMSRVVVLLDFLSGNFRGSWNSLFGNITTDLQRHYLNMEGYSRVQAIEMCRAHTMTTKFMDEKKEKGGILGLFSK